MKIWQDRQQQGSLLIGPVRRPAEDDDAGPGMMAEGEDLAEVSVGREQHALLGASSFHDLMVDGAER